MTATKPELIWRKRIADTETPVSAALKLFVPERGDFILESVEGGETRGRHSLIGIAPDLVFRAAGDKAEINSQWMTDRDAFAPSPLPSLDALRALAADCRMDVPGELPPALACLVGYFGYETIGLVEKLPRAPQSALELPDMLFVRPTVILVFDRLKDEMFLVSPVWTGLHDAQAVALANERLDETERLLNLGQVPSTGAASLSEDRELKLTPVLPEGRITISFGGGVGSVLGTPLVLTPGSGTVSNAGVPAAPLAARAPVVWGCGVALTSAFRYVPANCRYPL